MGAGTVYSDCCSYCSRAPAINLSPRLKSPYYYILAAIVHLYLIFNIQTSNFDNYQIAGYHAKHIKQKKDAK